jgi:restriction system protein
VDETQVLWGFHIYANGDAFVKEGRVALGWPGMGDLNAVPPTRDGFKAKVKEVFGDQSHVTNSAGQLFRFVHEMKIGDIVLYRSKVDRQIYLGRVKGPYSYRPDLNKEFCNIRDVQWAKTVPATQFSQGALYELGSALTLFQVRNYASEYQAALSGEPHSTPSGEDETVGIVADEVQQTTQDFILKELDRHLKGYPFQGFVANLLQTMGYRTHVLPQGVDEGIDIIAHRDELKLEPPIIKVQVKSGSGTIGGPDVRALFGNLGPGEYGLLVALGTFSPQARDFAKRKPNLRLIDGAELVDFLMEHYEDLDPKFKASIPLKRIYIPQPSA